MLRQDSIHNGGVVEPLLSDTATHTPSRPQTPYQVLRLLPKDATPAQQDSAVQAWFQPGEIHYSDQPDTLHLPGHDVGRNPKDVNIPQYYRKTFFSQDTLYHTEVGGGRFGVTGIPVPHSIHNDDMVSLLLILSFFVAIMAFSACKTYLYQQVKDLLYPYREHHDSETAGEFRAQLYFLLLTSGLFSLLYYLYANENLADTFVLTNNYYLLAIFFGVICGYFFLKALLYSAVNLVFFDGKKNRQWLQTLLFITTAEGIFLFPATLLFTYFDITSQSVAYYVLGVLVLVKLLTFYKCFVTFFRQNGLYLQIILYFCALEVIPLLVLWNGLEVIVNALKINF